MNETLYYVVTAKEGGDSDIFYYVFTDKYYCECFFEFFNILTGPFPEKIVGLISDAKIVDEMFDWIDEVNINYDYLDNNMEEIFEPICKSVSTVKELNLIINDGIVESEAEILIP
jgi:hypothetical protein